MYKKFNLYLFFLYFEDIFFLTCKIKNNKIGKDKKFINVRLYGAKPNIVKLPIKKGSRNKITNLLLNKLFKFKIILLTNCV